MPCECWRKDECVADGFAYRSDLSELLLGVSTCERHVNPRDIVGLDHNKSRRRNSGQSGREVTGTIYNQ